MDIGKAIESINEWIMSKFWHALVGVAVGLAIFALGFDTAFFLPGRLKSQAILEAKNTVLEAQSVVPSVQTRFMDESQWYKPGAGYIDGLVQDVDTAIADIVTCSDVLNNAGNDMSWRSAVKKARDAQAQAEHAIMLTRSVEAKLDANRQLRDEVRVNLTRSNDAYLSVVKTLGIVSGRFATEEVNYLSKYTAEPSGLLAKAQSLQASAHANVNRATSAMPPDPDISGVGDPNTAQQELDKTKAAIDEINTLMTTVTSRLDYLAQADASAEPKRNEAEASLNQSQQYVDTTHVSTGFWLRDAYDALSKAKEFLNTAINALASIVEKQLVDKPAAYEAAGTSLEWSGKAVERTDAEVALVAAANRAIAQIATRISEVEGYISRATTAESTLRSYHATDTWSSVSENLPFARRQIADAKANAQTASGYMDLSVQRFADAKTLADTGLNGLDQAQTRSQAVVDLAATLEGFRTQFPATFASASSMVNAQTAEINRYGNDDRSAVNAYNEAVNLLNIANASAASGHYQNAVDQANLASIKANGTGASAHAAYDRRIAEEEAARRRAEEEQRRREEAARQAAEDAANSSSSGSGFGSSSDYGDSDYGNGGFGGSDSDYSPSGSDSDY